MDPDGARLWPAAGPRVPSGWTQAITPLTIGPCVGSCGTAAFLKKPVITSDLASDPLWADYRDVALSNGLRASWSQPLLSKNHEVLGTFAMYYAEPRSPSDSDLQLIEGAGHIALIAIEGERSQTALTKALDQLRRDEKELRQIVDAVPQVIAVMAPDGTALYANEFLLEYTGLGLEEFHATDLRARILHPDDAKRLRDERQKALARGTSFQLEQRVRGKDRRYR